MCQIHHDVDDDVDVDDSLPVHPGPDDGGADEKQENQEKTEHNIYQMSCLCELEMINAIHD